MTSTTERDTRIDYVFGYGSLVELKQPLTLGDRVYPAMPGRLDGFRRRWGVAMNNWETRDDEKHFVDPESGLKPRIAVAYLDIEEAPGETVNGLAVPVDARRLAEFDVREVNYRRIDVSRSFAPATTHRVFAYQGTDAARARSHAGEDGVEIFVSRQYVDRIRLAFAALGPDEAAEYERTTEPLGFAQRDLELRYPLPPSADVA